MAAAGLWKYFTKESHKEFVLSLHLLGDTSLPAAQQLERIYMLSKNTSAHYTRFLIPKKDGDRRELLIPSPLLKTVQRNLLHNELEKLPLSSYATAYRKSQNILNNAAPHQNKPMLLKIDIRDFFGSISYLMVYRALPRTLYPPSVATLLAHLCCYQDYLPQGAPTSAAVSNLVMQPFDKAMGAWCSNRGITYTRYCDDLAFSGDFDAKAAFYKVRSFLLSLGFEINQKKTQLLTQGCRQCVTGIVINNRPQVPRAYRRTLRKDLYYIEKYGVVSHLMHINSSQTPPSQPEQQACLQSLLGKVQFVLQVDPVNAYFLQASLFLREALAQVAALET